MQKMNFTDNQTAFEYAIYMIAASYVKEARCENERIEKNMLLQFKEQKTNKQYLMEEVAISYMDDLTSKLPKRVFDSKYKVRLTKQKNGTTAIAFISPKYVLSFRGIYKGERSKVECKFWVKRGLPLKAAA